MLRQSVKLPHFTLINFTLELRQLAGVEINDELPQLRWQSDHDKLLAFATDFRLVEPPRLSDSRCYRSRIPIDCGNS
jgi:hypothetical protein